MTGKASPESPPRKMKSSARYGWVAGAIMIVILAWMYLSPPAFSLRDTGELVLCHPLGPGMLEPLSLFSDHQDAVDRYLNATGRTSYSAEDEQDALVYLNQGCEDARLNQQTLLLITLLITLAVTLARLVNVRNKGQSEPTGRNGSKSGDSVSDDISQEN